MRESGKPAQSSDDVLVLNIRDGRICVPTPLSNITTYVLLEQEDWFEDEIHFVRRYLQPGMRVVDVGANLGVYTLALAKAVGKDGRVWAFEPTARTADLLERTLALNGLDGVVVNRSAVSDRSGMIAFAVTGKPEANYVASQETSLDEVVRVTCVALDELAATQDWGELAFLKLDVEGHELQALNGARALLARASPLVMFEIKEGDAISITMLGPLEELGYEVYRLLPGPMVLAPFDREAPIDGFQLNLFACKPQRAEEMAARGLLVRSAEGTKGVPPSQGWVDYLKGAPYARELAARWPVKAGFISSSADKAYLQGLAAYAASRDPQKSVAERCAWLELAIERIAEAASDSSSLARKMSYARVAWEGSRRVNAVNALYEVYAGLAAHGDQALTEPFLAPSPRYEHIPIGAQPRQWLSCAVREQFEKLRIYSSMYGLERTLEVLGPVVGDPMTSLEMDRRWQLARLMLKLQANPQPTPRLEKASEENLNPQFWAGSLPTLLVSASAPEKFQWDRVDTVKIVDVGAMALKDSVDPYESLTRAFRCEIIGFEPLEKECAELNRSARPGCRYLPYFVGDGAEHTFYETNTGMTSSLFEPNTPLLASFQHLEELTQVVATHQVKTRRLDDIAEVRGIDFLKLDVQGAELLVLRGATETLRDVLVVHTEVEFISLYKEQALFGDVDSFMRSQGFILHKFEGMSGRTFKPMVHPSNPYAPVSQFLWADAVYVRDFMRFDELSSAQLFKLAAILHENYGSHDLASLALEAYDAKTSGDSRVRYLRQLDEPARAEAVEREVPPPSADTQGDSFRLHIGGKIPVAGWKNLNAQPGPYVDYVGECSDLSQFADESIDEIYTSHVLEHLGYLDELPRALAEFHRVLKPGGNVKISVPDLEILCRMFLDPKQDAAGRLLVMRMMFGGQLDPYDFHRAGLTQEILIPYLRNAGFTRLDRAENFGLNDTSAITVSGTAISLNVVAYK